MSAVRTFTSPRGSTSRPSTTSGREWPDGLTSAAVEGHVDTWQDEFGDSMDIRLTAGPFPGSSRGCGRGEVDRDPVSAVILACA